MNFMNEHEIESAVATLSDTHVGRYAAFLSNYKDVVNANSDGWPYWKSGVTAADRLITLLKTATGIQSGRSRGELPSEADLKRSVSIIRSFVTRKGLEQPVLPDPAEPAPGPR